MGSAAPATVLPPSRRGSGVRAAARPAPGVGTGAVTRIHDTNPEVQEHLTVAEVALMLRVSRATVYRVVLAGHLTGMRFGRSVRIPRAAVEHYVRGAALGDKDA